MMIILNYAAADDDDDVMRATMIGSVTRMISIRMIESNDNERCGDENGEGTISARFHEISRRMYNSRGNLDCLRGHSELDLVHTSVCKTVYVYV